MNLVQDRATPGKLRIPPHGDAFGMTVHDLLEKEKRCEFTFAPELIQAFQQHSRANGMTAKQLLVKLMRDELFKSAVPVGLPARSEKAKSGKLDIQLSAAEIEAVREAAKVDGYSLSGWVAMLVRAKLKQAPFFTREELSGLLKAATQLMAIGRNINAAVRKLHAEGKWTQQNQPMLAALEAIETMKAKVNALQAAAERRSTF